MLDVLLSQGFLLLILYRRCFCLWRSLRICSAFLFFCRKIMKVFSYYFIIDFVLQTDWKARADVAKLLKHLKKELTLLVVSHDLRYGN